MSSRVKTGTLYIGMGLVLGAGLALILVLGSQIAPLRSGPALTAQPINTVLWFGALPAVQIPGAVGQNPGNASGAAPSCTLYGTSLFTSSRWALIGGLPGGGNPAPATTENTDGAENSDPLNSGTKWVEEGGMMGEYRVKRISAREVILTRPDGNEEWTLALSGGQPEGMAENPGNASAAGAPHPDAQLAVETSASGCHGAIKVPRMAMDVLNQQQALLLRGLEVQGGGLRVRPELAALLGGLGFMANDILISSSTGPLNAPQTLARFVIVPLLRGKEVKIEGLRGGEQRTWRLMSEASCK